MRPTIRTPIRTRFSLTTLSTALLLGLTVPAQDGSRKQDTGGNPAAQVPQIPADKDPQDHPLGIRYSILQAGTGTARPSPGDDAIVNFHEWLSDGTLIDSTSKRGQPVRVRIGDPQLPLALSFGPRLVGKGGKVKITVPPEKAYGKAGQVGRIPPNSTIVYLVELVDYMYRPKQAQFIKGDAAKTKATASGVKYQVLETGEGQKPGKNDIVELEFTAWSITGEVILGTFQSGRTEKAPIQSMSHPFFREVLPMMQRNSVWRIVAPASQTVEQIQEDTVWQLRLVNFEPSEIMPPSNDKASTTTKSGLQYERLVEGKGDRPMPGYLCEVEFDFWQEDGTYVAGTKVQGSFIPVIVGRQEHHKFLDEIVQLMQVGEVMRVEVPDTMTAPRMLRFNTVWRLKLLGMKKPLPSPKFELPADTELTKTRSGLKYKVLSRGDGTGQAPRQGELVTVHYAGWTTDGNLFDSSYRNVQEARFMVGQVIPGFSEGLQLMKPGDSFLFVIPGSLGYGARGTPDGVIPPDATLVFHVKLIAVGS